MVSFVRLRYTIHNEEIMLNIRNLFSGRSQQRAPIPSDANEVVDIVLDPALAGRKPASALELQSQDVPPAEGLSAAPMADLAEAIHLDVVMAPMPQDVQMNSVAADASTANSSKRARPPRKAKPTNATKSESSADSKPVRPTPRKGRLPSMKAGAWTLPEVKPVVLQYVDAGAEADGGVNHAEDRASALVD